MSWNLEGMHVCGLYLSGDMPVSGKVVHSRVCYGGGISHHIELDEGFQWKNSAGKVVIKRDAGEVVILDHKYVTRVRD